MGRRSRAKRREGRGRRRAPEAHIELLPVDAAPRWKYWAAVVLIAASVLAVYANTLGNDFVTWDDRDYIYENPLLPKGLGAIWGDLFAEKPHEQYYPIVFSSYWIEYQFVELEPWLYHATQMVLHAINAALLVFVLRALGAGFFPAVVAGALFAVHPINVASVAWVTERKNTLSALFFFLSLLLYIQFRRSRRGWPYVGAMGSFILGLLSKSAIVTLAPILVLTDRILDGRWSWASLRRTSLFFALGLGMAIVTMVVEERGAKSGVPVAVGLRPIIAAAALTHYVTKLVVPLDLVPVYPRWSDDLATCYREPRYVLSVIALLVAGVLIVRYRRRLGPMVLWGLGVFLLATSPMLGLRHFNYMQSSFVSDHFLYHSAPGLFLIVGLLLDRLRRRGRTTVAEHAAGSGHPAVPTSAVKTAIVGAILVAALAACGWLTVKQNRVWKNGVTFWEYTLSKNPDEFGGHYNLGNHYYRNKDYAAALKHYIGAMGTTQGKTHLWSRRSCARCCRQLGQTKDAIKYYRQMMTVADETNRRAVKDHLEFADYLRRLGRDTEALVEYEAILKKRPTSSKAIKEIRKLRDKLEPAGPDGK